MKTKILLTFAAFNPIRMTRRETFDTFDQAVAFAKTDKMGTAELFVVVEDHLGRVNTIRVGNMLEGGVVQYTDQWLYWAAATCMVPTWFPKAI